MYLCGINKIKEYSVTDNVIFICCTLVVVQGEISAAYLKSIFFSVSKLVGLTPFVNDNHLDFSGI